LDLFYCISCKSCCLLSRRTGTRKYRATHKTFTDWLILTCGWIENHLVGLETASQAPTACCIKLELGYLWLTPSFILDSAGNCNWMSIFDLDTFQRKITYPVLQRGKYQRESIRFPTLIYKRYGHVIWLASPKYTTH
jgi:hypothetical protein